MTKLLEELAVVGGDGEDAVASDAGFGVLTAGTTGTLVGFTDAGEALVRVAGVAGDLTARSTVVLSDEHTGADVALMFANGDRRRPIVLGVLTAIARASAGSGASASLPFELEIDQEKIELRTARQIVVRCGAASVTMTHDGRIILRGTDVLSRSTGLNRIKGAAVQIN